MNFISQFLLTMLRLINDLIGNYAWAVVLFTFLVRLVLMPLDIKSKSSMNRMQTIQPQITALQKKYANDKEKLNQKTQEIYRKEKINPLSGCLPMLLQMPILFCMFTAMRVLANEMTVQMLLDAMQTGVMPPLQSWFWVKNVFQPDSFMATIIPVVGDKLQAIQPVAGTLLTAENIETVRNFLTSDAYMAIAEKFGATGQYIYSGKMLMWDLNIPAQINGWFLLPVIAGVSQFFSSKFMNLGQAQSSPDPNNPQNANMKMMQWFMPLFSVFICATSSAAFSLYWVFISVIQIVQQTLINLYFKNKQPKKPEEA